MITPSYLGFTPTSKPRTAQIPRFKIGVAGDFTGNWDLYVKSAGFADWYKGGSLEHLMEPLYGWSGEYDDLNPVLATSWTLFNWPSEMNYHPTDPFINEGGLMAIELTLREGVTFHDGSAWNATAAKWNIDRTMVITGNITGKLTAFDMYVYQARANYWLDAVEWVDYETDSWNVSQYIGQPATYAEFGSTLESEMNGKYCRIKNVTIIEDLASGGKMRINFNDWGGANMAMLHLYSLSMISMDAYNDYFDLPIYGLGQDPAFPQPEITGSPDDYPSTGFPGHLIGTGPYIFVEHNTSALQGGWMKRNPNWWNFTAAQANGWHQVPEIGIVTFATHTSGLAARNLAMLTGAIDLAYDTQSAGSLVYEEMDSNPNINYVTIGYEPSRTFITLNSINETYWKTWADLGPGNYPTEIGDLTNLHDIDSDGTIHTDGINRALRKALSFAFDYDIYINNVLQGRGVRSGGFLGIENEYYNSSIPIAYRNLTIARQTLINDPFWAPIAAARNLDIHNTTADWIWVANNDPIFEFKLLWEDSTKPQADLFSTSIKEIGIRLGSPGPNYEPDPLLKLDPDIFQVMIMRIGEFPAFTYHGVPTNWPDTNIGNLPVLEYYYKSPGLPYENGSGVHWPSYTGGQFFNIGFHYNSTVDRYLELLRFSDRTTSQEIMNNLTIHSQTYQYPEIFISHIPWGFAIDKDWEQSYYRETAYQFIKYVVIGDIALSSDAGSPDIDGKFNLIWNVSVGADNYSIYRSSSLITEINGSLALIAAHNATSPYSITGLSDGTYYFVVVAHNQHGDTLSNNINIIVQLQLIPPISFVLSSDADFPDNDGFFNLSWTTSVGADNYSIYKHNHIITQINESLNIIEYQNATSPFSVSGLSNGEYHFVVVAYNQYGDTISNNVHVTVSKPGGSPTPGISGYDTLMMLGMVIFTVVILFKRTKRKYKWK